jgi:hypothetical protein
MRLSIINLPLAMHYQLVISDGVAANAANGKLLIANASFMANRQSLLSTAGVL